MIKMIQRVGDRDKVSWSIKDIAFTIPANPMSDRVQMVLEYEERLRNLPDSGQERSDYQAGAEAMDDVRAYDVRRRLGDDGGIGIGGI